MGIMDDAAEAMRAILSATGNPPNVVIVPGTLIIKQRPDLADEIDPGAVYRVTHDSITKMEVEDGN